MNVAGAIDPTAQLRNVKDFLVIYNSMTEQCFTKCVTNMNYRKVSSNERSCVLNCTELYMKGNQRLMQIFMQHTPDMVRKRNEEAEKQAARLKAITENAQETIENPQSTAMTSNDNVP